MMVEEVEADVDLLLECIQCQLDCPSALKQALLALANLCDKKGDAVKEYIRRCSGLKLILRLVTSSELSDVHVAAVYSLGCAVEKNVYSQQEMCIPSLFNHLYGIFTTQNQNSGLLRTTCYLLTVLAANNIVGQTMVRSSGCLESLIMLFKCFPVEMKGMIQNGVHSAALDIELWSAVASTLNVCVDNPQNADNQKICAIIYPCVFRTLDVCTELEIIKQTASLTGSVTDNNVQNQKRVFQCGGIGVLVNCLNRLINRFRTNWYDHLVCGTIEAVISCLTVVVMENKENCQCLGRLGGIALLLDLLHSGSAFSTKLRVLIILGHCTDCCEMNQIEMIKLGGVATLIKELTESREEELSCAVKYVLHACIKTDRKHSILNQYGALKASAKYQECDYSVSHFNMETDCGQCDPSRGNHIKSLSPVNEYKVLSLYNMEVTKKLDKLQSLLEDHLFMANMPYSSETSVKANNVQHDIRGVSLTVNSQKNVTRPSSSMVCDASKWPTERSSCSLHGGGNTRDQYERNLTRSVSCMLGKQHDEQITGSSGKVQLIQLTPKSYTRRTEIHNRCLDQSCNECNCCKANDNCLAHRHEKDDPQTNDKQVDIRRHKSNKLSRLLDDQRKIVCREDDQLCYGQVQVEDASPQDNHSYHNLSASNRLSVCHHCCELTRNELDIDVITRSSKLRKKTACLGHVDVHSSVLDNQAKNSEENSDVKCPKDPFVKPFQPPLSRLSRIVESLEADNMSVYESEFDSHVLQNAKLNSLRQNISSDVDSKQQTGNNGSKRKPNNHLSSSKGYPDLGRVNKSGKNVFVQRCPGCQTPAECQLPVLNSRNYSIAIETSCYTCSYHRLLREQERIFISGVKKSLPQHRKCSVVTPPCALDTGTTPMSNMISSYHSKRRPRVPYTNEEVEALLKGVTTRGRKWSSILHSFKFHPSRTAVDLKDKYKRLIMTKSPGRQTSKTEVKKPFSMAEVRRLKRGVRLFGYSWKTVLSCMQFSRGRTARELREKWRTLNRTRLV